MPLFDQIMKSDLTKGIAIGIGAAVVAPLAYSMLSGSGRPLARAALKAGILLFEKAHETAAELGEVFDDLVAEAQAELREQRHAAQATAEAATAAGEAAAEAVRETAEEVAATRAEGQG
ncbi:MAG: DUF5132 domain-containing protein [Gammaproteobacteria bacterium]|jgi:hypothetical protein